MTPDHGGDALQSGEGWLGMFAWSAALVLGQLVLLQLVHAGNSVGYQHLESLDTLIATRPVLLGLYGVYVAAVSLGGWLVRGRWAAFTLPRRTAVAIVVLVVFASSAALSAAPVDYLLESTLLFGAQVVAAVNLCLVATTLPRPAARRLDEATARWLGSDSPDASSGETLRWALGPAALVLVVSVLLAVTIYQGRPHIPDELAFYLQAKYLAKGLLWMPAPPVPSGFDVDLMTIDGGRWFSAMPPGWPAMLAVGVAAGVPWLINPMLGAVNIVLAYAALRVILPQRTARIATILLALSPWHGFLAMSLMSHTFSLTLALVASLAVAKTWKGGSAWWCLLGGAAIGFASVNRPLEGVALAMILGTVTLGLLVAGRRLMPSLLLGLGTLVTGATGLAYNAAVTGRAMTFPVEDYFRRVYGEGRYEIGFGPTRGLGWPGLDPLPGHGAPDVVINALLNLFQVNTELFGWACGSLALVVLALAYQRPRGVDLVMLSSIVAVTGLHSFFWFSGGPDFGARYWFLIIIPCVALAARGWRWIEGTDAIRRGRSIAAAGVLSLGSMAVFYPWRAIDKYDHYRGMSSDGATVVARSPQVEGALILVSGRRFPDFASMASHNPVDVRGGTGTILAWDRDSVTRARLLAAYAGRPAWRLVAPPSPGDAWSLVALPGADSAAGAPPSSQGPTH